jgi:hypothetical protein
MLNFISEFFLVTTLHTKIFVFCYPQTLFAAEFQTNFVEFGFTRSFRHKISRKSFCKLNFLAVLPEKATYALLK